MRSSWSLPPAKTNPSDDPGNEIFLSTKMPKQAYRYNPETCDYEPIPSNRRKSFFRFLFRSGTVLALAAGMVVLYFNFFTKPEEIQKEIENQTLKIRISLLQEQIQQLDHDLTDLQERDDQVYRMILEADAVPPYVRKAGIGGIDRYSDIKRIDSESKEEIIEYALHIDKLKRRVYIQSLSMDEIENLAREQQRFYAHLPGIQPIPNHELRRLSTIFGMRMHPILKIMRPHKGLDFMAPKGTPVYATGDGKVRFTRYSKTFGKMIDVDHGYGYISRYAHLNTYNVKPGDYVKRGQVIGTVGNTGLSVSDHLHYEILKENIQVNPLGYFQRELSKDQYEKLIELSLRETVPLD